MSGNEIVSLVSILLCLILAWRGFRARRLSADTTVKMALAWGAIFAGGVAIVSWIQR